MNAHRIGEFSGKSSEAHNKFDTNSREVKSDQEQFEAMNKEEESCFMGLFG